MGLATAATAGGAGLSAIGSILGGISGAASANAQARLDRQQAVISAQNADTALDQGLQQTQRDYQAGSQKLGAARAQMAANGVVTSGGSALQVQQGIATETGQNVAADMYNANAKAVGYRNEATSYDNQATMAKRQATSSLVTGAVGAAGSVLSGVSQFSSKWDDMVKSGSVSKTASMWNPGNWF